MYGTARYCTQAGSLKLDMITYRVPPPEAVLCDDEDVQDLLTVIRGITLEYQRAVLRIVGQYLPGGTTAEERRRAKEKAEKLEKTNKPKSFEARCVG